MRWGAAFLIWVDFRAGRAVNYRWDTLSQIERGVLYFFATLFK